MVQLDTILTIHMSKGGPKMNEEQRNVNEEVKPVQQANEIGQQEQPAGTGQAVSAQQQSKNNGMAITALILGVVSIVLSWIPFIPYITAILAIVFGFLGLRIPTQKVLGIIGIVLGAATFILKIGFWIMLFLGIAAELSY